MQDYKKLGSWRRYQMIRRRKVRAMVVVVLAFLVYGFVGYLDAGQGLEAGQEREQVDAAQDLFVDIPRELLERRLAQDETREIIETVLPTPVAVAIAERADYPLTLASIAHAESRGDRKAVGDAGQARGAFQVWGKHHGTVPDSIEGQVDQANRLFLQMVAQHGYREAVARWNGSPANPKVKEYQRRVLAKVQSLEARR